MARKFASASSQRLDSTGTMPVTAASFTMACWFQVSELTNGNALFSIADNSVGNQYFALLARGDLAGDPVEFAARQGSAGNARTTTAPSVDTWHHAIAVEIASNSRQVYLDNGGLGADNTNKVPNGLDILSIGSIEDSTPIRGDSIVAEAAIWNVVISAASRAALAAGVCPLLVQPNDLVFYDPLPSHTGDSQDLIGELTLTDTGGVTANEHPPITYPLPATVIGPPPTGQLDAALGIAFNIAADLKAQGKLDAALGPALNITPDLKAQGKLDAALAIAFNVATDLKATGKLDAALGIVFAVLADLKATGKLDAALATAFAIAADLKADGKLDAALAVAFGIVADLSDATGGLISANLPITFAVAADLKARGRLRATLPMIFAIMADLKANGKLDASLPFVLSVIADLKAQGKLDAALPVVFALIADLKAQAKLDAALLVSLGLAADLTGTGQINTALPIRFTLSGNLLDVAGDRSGQINLIGRQIAVNLEGRKLDVNLEGRTLDIESMGMLE